MINLESTPAGTEIYVDGASVSNAPAQLKLAPGKHSVKVVASGYQDWARELEVLAGSEVTLNARLTAVSGSSAGSE